MNNNELLKGLGKLVTKYISDGSLQTSLLGCLDEQHVKYILGEIEGHRTCPVSECDEELIKDLFFHFC